MQAVYLTAHGGNEAVAIGPRPFPVLQDGQALVRLRAATLNRVDLYMRDSGAGITHTLPQIMGVDGAGVIEALQGSAGSKEGWQVGQAVLLYPGMSCGHCEFCARGEPVLCTRYQLLGEHRDGTFAEFVAVPQSNLVPMPPSLNFVQAAALGVNHLTAWRMLFSKARLKPSDTVLIFGIGGGVSLAALQLVKALGAKALVTSTSDDKLKRALAMGADFAINSRREDVAKAVLAHTQGRGVDVVFENVGAAVWASAMKSLVRGGVLVTCGATTGDQPGADLRRLFIRQITVMGSTLGNPQELRELVAFCERHAILPVIDSEWPLAEAHQALSRLESGQQFGKVALVMD